MFVWEKPQIHTKDFKFMSISYQFNSSFFVKLQIKNKILHKKIGIYMYVLQLIIM